MVDVHWWEWDQPRGLWPASELRSSTFREVVARQGAELLPAKDPSAWQQTHLVQVLKKGESGYKVIFGTGFFPYCQLFMLFWCKIYIAGTTHLPCASVRQRSVFLFFHVGSKPFSPFSSSSLESSLLKYRIFPCVSCSTWFWHMFESINWEEKKKITPGPLLRGVINDFRLIENVCSKSSNWAPFWLTAFSDFVTLQNVLFSRQWRGKDHLISLQNLYERNLSFSHSKMFCGAIITL